MFAPRGWLSRKIHREMYRTLSASELFDRARYRQINLRGLAKLQDPIWHFIAKGWKKRLSPSERFDIDYYIMKNDDVRTARLNPLFHFESYGRAERRLPVRSPLEAQHVAIPEATPLRFFITPLVGQNRVSILLDSATHLNFGYQAEELLKLASQRADKESSSLRVLYRGNVMGDLGVSKAIESLPPGLLNSLEITKVPSDLTYSDIPFFDQEISISTSWSSSLALRYATDEGCSFAITAEGQEMSLVVNDDLHRQGLLRQHTTIPEALPRTFVDALSKRATSTTPWILAYVDIELFPLAYSVVVEALSHFILAQPATSQLPAVTLVGKPGPSFSFAEELEPQLETLHEFAVGASTASCVLVVSRHDDTSVELLENSGFTVVHATHPEPRIAMVERAKNRRTFRCSVSADSIQVALSEALS